MIKPKRKEIQKALREIERIDKGVVVEINGSGHIMDMIAHIVAGRLNNFEGKYHLFVNGERVDV